MIPVAMATKFGTKKAITRLVHVWEISRRSLRLTGGFRGWAIEWCQTNSTATNPCCHGNEIRDQIGYNSACIRDISETCLLTGVFWGRAIEWCQTNSTATNPCCHGNEIWDKIGYNSACIRDIREIFVYNREFSGSDYWITLDKFYHDHPPLPWQRNLGQNRL